jgi:hypothetical protein
MPRSRARVVNFFGKLVIAKKNPWYSERLLNLLTRLGKKPKKPETILATPPPWFMNPSAMPQAVYERAKLFSEVSSQTAGKPIEERLKTIQEKLKLPEELKKPRKSRAKEPGKRFHELYPTYEKLRGIAPAQVATAPARAPTAPAPATRPEIRA